MIEALPGSFVSSNSNKGQSTNGAAGATIFDYRFQVFTVCWSIAVLFHMAHSRFFANGLHYALLTIAAVLVIAKPSSLIRFIAFLALQITASLRIMPFVSNHEILVLFADFTILHVVLYQAFRAKSFELNRAEIFDIFAPLIRAELIIFYFFVVFHKLNTSFFNTDLSCAAEFYNSQNTYSLLPSSRLMVLLNVYFTLFVEALIPILLCFRKSRNLGLFIGLVFHCIIAFNPINGFFDISAAIYAAYIVFATKKFSYTAYRIFESARGLVENILNTRFSNAKLFGVVAGTAFFALTVYVASKAVDDYFRYIFWSVFSALFIFIFLKSLYLKTNDSAAPDSLSFRMVHLSLGFFPFIVFLNGLCPYLGLKTESSYAMFSNLRTEGGATNHFLVPASVQIFDYQKDIVEVVSSSGKVFQGMANRKEIIPFFQFKEMVSTLRPAKVEYLRNGKPYSFDLARASQGDELLVGNPFLMKKTMRFRAVSKYEPQPCKH